MLLLVVMVVRCEGSYKLLITYYLPVCYFLKNTTIPWEYYLQYPVNTTYNNGSEQFAKNMLLAEMQFRRSSMGLGFLNPTLMQNAK